MVGQIFGMPGKGKAGVVDDALVYRCRDDCVVGAVHTARKCGIQQGQDVGAVARIEHPRGDQGSHGEVTYME